MSDKELLNEQMGLVWSNGSIIFDEESREKKNGTNVDFWEVLREFMTIDLGSFQEHQMGSGNNWTAYLTLDQSS